MTKKFSLGFSLLELLVVISIIGILVSIGTVAFTSAQKTSRDSRRRADVKSMQDAFEQYMADNGTYEACATMADYDTGSGALMPAGLPEDPRNTGSYVYNTGDGCDATGYCVCALLESGTGNANQPVGVSCAYAAGGDYYCLSQRQ
ncbi:MAG TPA: prepilin-type N-terminal cleavage/methylation domain-containing protein [Patescibacteria group bacterium]|jgi:prepilin-type N-terminal cleavage/methylation domain-containing protein